MSSFIEIENIYPEWPEARHVMMKLIPKQIVFVIDRDHNEINPDTQWVYDIVCMTPDIYREDVIDRLSKAWDHAISQIDQGALEKFINMSLDIVTLMAIEMEVTSQAFKRQLQGLPTFVEIIEHHMGIKRNFYLDGFIQKNLEIGDV